MTQRAVQTRAATHVGPTGSLGEALKAAAQAALTKGKP